MTGGSPRAFLLAQGALPAHGAPRFPALMIRLGLILLLALLLPGQRLRAERVGLIPAEAGSSSLAELAEVVDGSESGPAGWIVPAGTTRAAIFRTTKPLPTGRLRLWLTFRSGQKDSHFQQFGVAITRDPQPSLASVWEPLFPVWFHTTSGELSRAGDRLQSTGAITPPVFRLDAVLAQGGVTGIRVEGAAADSAAVLTGLRVERLNIGTTNVALGCAVRASHELGLDQRAEFLTDGLSGTVAHPRSTGLGSGFSFEIDLARSYELDHISLRGRADSQGPQRLSRVKLAVYAEPPSSGATPNWEVVLRENGTFPEPGQVDVIRARSGKGIFQGRYLRISSASPVDFSPELAEVEVYPSLVPPGVSVETEGQRFPGEGPLEIPAGLPWLSFAIEHPGLSGPLTLGRRWRLQGWNDTWLPVTGTGIVESRGLPPGRFEFQAQMRHTDNEWNDAMFRVPIIVPVPWWQNGYLQSLAALGAAGLASLAGWRFARHRLARRVADLERREALDKERSRIARDMHDVVGSRLTQLAVMQEIFAAEFPQSNEAQGQLRRLSGTAREAVAALDEAVWVVNPRNDTLQNLADYLCHAATDYLAPLGIACRQDVPPEWITLTVGAQKRHQLLLAFKEALQNVVKHAGATTVTLRLRYIEPSLFLGLEDNGRGLPEDVSGVSKDGLQNMQTRLAAVGGECDVRKSPHGGTLVEMRIPL